MQCVNTNSLWVAHCCLQKYSVALQEFLKGVSNGKSQLSDAYRVDHTRVSKLTHAQLSVERLKHRDAGSEQIQI